MHPSPSIPFALREPWVEESNGGPLECELKKELREDGILYGKTVKAVARRIDCDDVLFAVEAAEYSLAVVHLTWSGKKDANKGWPSTDTYKDWEEWKQFCMTPDADDYEI